MVKGLDVFREHFADYREHYVLIGGSACHVQFEDAGLEFRATKDIDIVLCIEAINESFLNAFWEFVRAGQYEQREKSTGKKEFYRFVKPKADGYPAQLELFSHRLDSLRLAEDDQFTRIPADGEADSLSAILLNESYYKCLQNGAKVIDGVRVLKPEYLLVFKARAYLDLSEKRNKGEGVQSGSVRKHKRDVFQLFRILASDQKVSLPDEVKADLKSFIEAMRANPPDIASIGIRNKSVEEVLNDISGIYGINPPPPS